MCRGGEYVYYLPKEDGSKEEYKTKANSIIIIGANGSGKSRLGAWMERQDIEGIHRIGGQRSLVYNKDLTLRPYSVAHSLLKFGQIIDDNKKANKIQRWGWDDDEYITKELHDFEFALAALFSLHNEETNKYHEMAKLNSSAGKVIDKPSKTVIDKLKYVWNAIFPYRELKYLDYNFWIKYNGEEYNAHQMSDGEREVLYLASQVLSISEGKVNSIIIDEPEIHLHPSIMNNLWLELEKVRKDLLFIYITHDISFASTHRNSDKIWINEYLGSEKWNYQVLNKNEELPEELLFEILGCRQNILFVEGDNNSYDYRLYSILFPNFYIIPCGGCEQVILRTKAVNKLNNTYNLYKYNAFGLIDRDYRSKDEIGQYENDKVYCLKVAEIENIFIAEKVLKHIAQHMGKINDWEKIFLEIKNFVIETKYKHNIKKQVFNNIKYDINKRIKSISVDGQSEEDIQNEINNMLDNIDYQQIKSKIEKKFNSCVNAGYDEVLTIYNEKGLSKNVGKQLGLNNESYCDTIIGMLSSDDELKNSFYEYIPKWVIEAHRNVSDKA